MEQPKENKRVLNFKETDIQKPNMVSYGAITFADPEHPVAFVIVENMKRIDGFTASFQISCLKHNEKGDVEMIPGRWMTFAEAEKACNEALPKVIEHVERTIRENGGC